MKYFITGGAGFIGSNLAERLDDVTIYDNFSTGNYIKPASTTIRADVIDLPYLTKAMRGHECVFHLAASNDIAGGLAHTDLDLRNGTLATYNVLEAMRINGIKKLVYSSSATVYGNAEHYPTSESDLIQPISLYGASKVASESLIRAYCNLFDMQAWIFRFGNVTGKRQNHGCLHDFINKLRDNPDELEIWGDGTQKRCFFLVQDCVDGILFGLEHAKEQVNVFNLGVSSMTDINTVVGILTSEMGLNPKVRYVPTFKGDVPQVSLNVEKMAKLGWTARFESTDAVRQAVKDILND